MREPRFTVNSTEAFIEAALHADPPIREGDHAELVLPRRCVTLVSSLVDHMIVWTEIDAAEPA